MSPFRRNRCPEPLERVLFRFLRRQLMHIRRALTLAARAGGCELRVVARRGSKACSSRATPPDGYARPVRSAAGRFSRTRATVCRGKSRRPGRLRPESGIS